MKSNHPDISVVELGKSFKFYDDRGISLKDYLIKVFSKKRGKKPRQTRVLENISFEIYAGEFVGIMGGNGVGKSTLLKLISGIYLPSEGTVTITKQIAPLIELGAGFHPDLTGFENIFLNASILGYGKLAVSSAVPDILAFAELGDKIYMPVKHYSSGMLARLGFAVATHLPAPIILIDEIMAVGDIGFQAKCLKKIKELHSSGKTIVLISHDPEAIERHCTRCIVLSKNKKVYDGAAFEGGQVYRRLFQVSP